MLRSVLKDGLEVYIRDNDGFVEDCVQESLPDDFCKFDQMTKTSCNPPAHPTRVNTLLSHIHFPPPAKNWALVSFQIEIVDLNMINCRGPLYQVPQHPVLSTQCHSEKVSVFRTSRGKSPD